MHALLTAAQTAVLLTALIATARHLARQSRRDREAIQIKSYAKGGIETD